MSHPPSRPRTGERVTAPLRPVRAAPVDPLGPPPHCGPVAAQVVHLRATSKAVADTCPAVSAWLGAQCRVAAELLMRNTRQWCKDRKKATNKGEHLGRVTTVAPSATSHCEHCGLTFVVGQNCRVRRSRRRRGRKAAPGRAQPQASRTMLQCMHCLHTATLTAERVPAQQTPPAKGQQHEAETPASKKRRTSAPETPAAEPPTSSPLGLAAFLAEVTRDEILPR